MNTAKYFLALGIAFLSLGCPVRSLFPLFTKSDTIAIPAIAGTWVNGDGETFLFQTAGDKGYDVVFREKDGDSTSYKVQTGKIGKAWFLDSYPKEKNHDYHLIAAHCISRVRLAGDSLHISMLEGDWLKKMIDRGKVTIPHITSGEDIILTASTDELQKLVLHFADDNDAFPESGGFVRMK
jgi:hypothetical protein